MKKIYGICINVGLLIMLILFGVNQVMQIYQRKQSLEQQQHMKELFEYQAKNCKPMG